MADRATRGIAWAGAVNVLGGASGALTGLLIAGIVGRELGTDGAGTYFLAVAVFLIASNIAELGADTGLVRFVATARATGRLGEIPQLLSAAVRPVIATGWIIVLAVSVVLHQMPDLFDGFSPRFVVFAAGMAVLSSLNTLMLSASRGFGQVVTYPLLQNVTLPVLRLVGVAAVLLAGGGVLAALTAWMLPVLLVLVLSTGVVLTLLRDRSGGIRTTRVRLSHRRAQAREFWSFSAVRGVSAAVEILLEWADVILVGMLASAPEAGIYAVVTRCARASELIHQASRIAIGPQIASALARQALDEAREIYSLITAAMIWMGWPFFIVLAVFGDAVLSIFGPGFDQGFASLVILSLAMALATAAGAVQTILLMGGRSTWQLADKSIALTINVALNLAFIPLWGIEGAALAWAVTILVDTALVVYQVQHLMELRPQWNFGGCAAALALGVVGTVSVLSRLVFGSSVPVMLVTTGVTAVGYLGLSWSLRDRLGLTALLAHRSAH